MGVPAVLLEQTPCTAQQDARASALHLCQYALQPKLVPVDRKMRSPQGTAKELVRYLRILRCVLLDLCASAAVGYLAAGRCRGCHSQPNLM